MSSQGSASLIYWKKKIRERNCIAKMLPRGAKVTGTGGIYSPYARGGAGKR